MSVNLYEATILILVAVNSQSEACDAIGEMLRPLLRKYDSQSCFIDWHYTERVEEGAPTLSDGEGFELE